MSTSRRRSVALALVVCACGMTPEPETPEPERWMSTSVQVAFEPGPEGAPAPTHLFWDWQGAMVPAGAEPAFGLNAELRAALDSLAGLRGAAIVAARRAHRAMPSTDYVSRLVLASKHPAIRGLLIERSYARSGWSDVTRAARLTLTLTQGPRAQNPVITAEPSLVLGRLLASVGALDAVIVDPTGQVVAATGPGFLPALGKLTNWQAIAEASGADVLAGPVFVEPGLDIPVRRVAVPITMPGQSTVIGWLLAKVYPGSS